MKIKLAFAAVATVCAVSAHANVIDFEDVSSPGCCTFPTSGYQGFEWSGSAAGDSWVLAEQGAGIFPGQQAHSGSNFAWSNGAADLYLSSSTAFDFGSMWARGGSMGFSFEAHGYRNGAEVYTQWFDVGTDYGLLTLNFQNVDKVVFDHQQTNLLIDDINVNPVPEPETYALLLAGLGVLGFLARRRKA